MSANGSVALFWILAILGVAVAMALVMLPLLRARREADSAERRRVNIAVYRDQLKELEADRDNGLLSPEQFETAKVELEGRLAEDALGAEVETATPPKKVGRWLGFTLGAVIPAIAFGLYFVVGNPGALQVTGTPGAVAQEQQHNVEALIQAAEAKLKENPKDGRGWLLMGRTYAALERWEEASHAYLTATQLLPDQASVWSGYAEVLAILRGRNLEGEPLILLEKAIRLDPNDPKALELLGIRAFQQQDYAKAVQLWTNLVGQMPPESEYTQQIRSGIEEANRLAQASGKPVPAGPSIRGQVAVSPALQAKVSPEAVVFVFARAASGPPMPLAAFKGRAGDLPLEFMLDDSMGMAGGKLSEHKEVRLMARVSNSGQPMAASGDLEGEAQSVKVGSRGVKIVIDKVVP